MSRQFSLMPVRWRHTPQKVLARVRAMRAGCFCQHLCEQRFVGAQPLLQTILRQPRGNADVQAAFAVRAQDNVFLGTAVDVQRNRVARQRINQRLHQRLLRPPKPKLRVLLYPLLVLR